MLLILINTHNYLTVSTVFNFHSFNSLAVSEFVYHYVHMTCHCCQLISVKLEICRYLEIWLFISCFTPHYPHVAEKRSYLGKKVDIWAAGVTLYCMMFGKVGVVHVICSHSHSVNVPAGTILPSYSTRPTRTD